MRKVIPVFLCAVISLAGCNKDPNVTPGSTTAANPAVNPNDPVERKLVELAGTGATNCGQLREQVVAQLDATGKCVMQSAQQKKAFYVAYDMPGMTVGIAGNAEGKLFSVQTQASATGGLSAVPCPAELRIAPSGRATCYAPGTFPMGAGSDMHGPMMTMPPTGVNPHQRMGAPPPGTANPHQQPKSPEKPQ